MDLSAALTRRLLKTLLITSKHFTARVYWSHAKQIQDGWLKALLLLLSRGWNFPWICHQKPTKKEMRWNRFHTKKQLELYSTYPPRRGPIFAVGQAAKFNHNPGLTHWREVKRIFRYLAGTRKHGIFFSPREDQGVVGFTDADHAGDLDDRGSTSGCVFLCHGGSISWFSRK